jgi:hypothetical protein
VGTNEIVMHTKHTSSPHFDSPAIVESRYRSLVKGLEAEKLDPNYWNSYDTRFEKSRKKHKAGK